MSPHLGPLRFEPFLRPMVWGGRALGTRLGKLLPTLTPYGESWDVSDHALHDNIVADGPWQGSTLRQFIERQREAMLGSAASRFDKFPWLIKFLDCCDWLSVQVHPDADKVKTLWPGEGSKTEAWYVIDAAPGSRIYAGLKPGVGPEQLRRALADGTVADCLHAFAPQPGDCVFLPAGTVHAVGGGVLMAEIQETSDATFRLFDWNRVDAQGKSRQLHVEEAFAAIHWDYGPVEPIRAPQRSGSARMPLVHCKQFYLEHIQGPQILNCGAGKLQALVVLAGQAHWPTGAPLLPGQVWVLPACLPPCALNCESLLSAVLVTLPD